MMRRSFLAVLAASQLLHRALGYGTTVYIADSYCPATTNPTTGTVDPTGTPTLTPYLIYVIPQPVPRLVERDTSFPYIAADGTITSDASTAARYQFDGSGRLSTSGGYISTSGIAAYQNFAPSQVLGTTSTLFAIDSNNTLSWTNNAFSPHNARFCNFNTIVQVIFSGDYPQGCNPVQLGVIEASKVSSPSSSSSSTTVPSTANGMGSASTGSTMTSTIINPPSQVVTTTALPSSPVPGSVQGALALANPIGCIFSDEVSPAVGSQGSSHSISTLEDCVDYCASFLQNQCFNLPFVGIQDGSDCYCGTSFSGQPAPGSCNSPCPGNAGEFCGGVSAMSIYQIVSRTPSALTLSCNPSTNSASPTSSSYPAPTTTGQPNCFDGSGFDGTVNDNYLILCDTSLPGYDLAQVDATDLADCIDQCNSVPPGSDGSMCVAVEFDILVSSNPCNLKYNVGSVSRGSNPFAQAAIIVNEPDAPTISFESGPSSTTTTATNASTSKQSQVQTTSLTTVSSPAPQTSIPQASSSSAAQPTALRPSTSLITTGYQQPSITYTGPSRSSTTVQGSSNSAPPTASPASSSRVVSSSSTFAMTAIPTSSLTASHFTSNTSPVIVTYPTPTASLCPNYDHQAVDVNNDNYNYEIECSTALNGVALVGNSSIATSLNNCIRFCTLYNDALPFQCLGVNFYPNYQSNVINCYLLGSVTGTTCLTSAVNAGRLIYDGYPAIADTDCLAPYTTPAQASTTTTSQAASTIVTSTTAITSLIAPFSSSSITTPASSALTPLSTTIGISSNTRLSTTLSTSTSSTSTSVCPAAPTAHTECMPSSPTPQCYSYAQISSGTSNYEVECATQFSGASLQAIIAQSLADCIFWCQYANSLTANACTGVTYTNGNVVQGGPNNCIRYSSLTCATRGNVTLDSARLLGGTYPAIADYTSSFNCPS